MGSTSTSGSASARHILNHVGGNQRIGRDLNFTLISQEDRTEDLSIARKPHFVVPFPPDPDFVHRPTIWMEMEKLYASHTRRMALSGMGGFGKSQLAIQFAYKVHADSPDTSIFWVNGSHKETFEESYRYIAEVLALPRRHDSGVNLLELVSDWLWREDVGPWLMIVDSVDDVAMLSENYKGRPIAGYLPQSNNGKILVTSRSLDAAEKLTGSGMAILRIPTMEQSQALQLCRNKLGEIIDEDAAIDLINALDYIPLAVNQAAAFIRCREEMTVRLYLQAFLKSERRKTSLLRSNRCDLRRYPDVSNSVVMTWQLTFDQIRRDCPRAASLLSLMSFFHAQNIPEYMLHGYDSDSSDVGDSSDDGSSAYDWNFKDDLAVLQGYSLATTTTARGFLEMHSLVQFCTQIWISQFGDRKWWETLFIQLASEHFPSGSFETWQKCQELSPHVQPLLDKKPSDDGDRRAWSELLTNVSAYRLMLGEYDRAEGLAREAMETRKDLLGEDHSDTLKTTGYLATIFWSQGWWDKAEELQMQVMETCKTKFGADHPDTLISISNLASTYRDQGRWDEAEKLDVQVVETRKLTADDPDMLTSMGNLASTYHNQGRWDEAEKLQVQVVETSKKILGVYHADTLVSTSNLASTYRRQGRLGEAEKLDMQVMETCETQFGADHPDTLRSMANLASTYCDQCRWDEAEKLQVLVMEAYKMKLRADHPDMLRSMANLASIYCNQGQLDEAVKLQVHVMETHKMSLRADHPGLLASMNNLAFTFCRQGRWDEAEKLQVQVMETRTTNLTPGHPDSLLSMNNLAVTWKHMGLCGDAILLMQNCSTLAQLILGPDHPHTVSALQNLEGWKNESESMG